MVGGPGYVCAGKRAHRLGFGTELPPPALLESIWFEPGRTRDCKLGWDGTGNGDETTSKGNHKVVMRLGVTGPEAGAYLNLDITESLSIN